ncbi:helix-turn-helix domain-containing protein [Kamptonema formosum]|uniref:helix-turn-helix domain-containing protein n=1 Tax=Kamptonema formosum TaxID=331992 RepID=UPI0003468E97|nr:helix-turn-helix transcriptional regulator [Oscillatoria sp. PCC 10802]
MAFSLGQRLRTTRELLGLTQEQVIKQLKTNYGVNLSQQALSCIENGKRKLDAERELPALAAAYGKPIHYFYDSWEMPPAPPTPPVPKASSAATADFQTLTQRDKLHLAAELIQSLLPET